MSKEILNNVNNGVEYYREVVSSYFPFDKHKMPGYFFACLSKTIKFTAGPFTNLTVATFINILKGAYSYYTLL
ncbi:uncharacterized protein LOC126973069 [Leptidea sinapis]|uniref:uncharacterized protein LOC126973069 n=1 Tax=Leptidea sinapis TaxID=189913 RepID=UPI0021C3136C|nr:uncharacterized protein LOC126973069 [Leptidea sinapis]